MGPANSIEPMKLRPSSFLILGMLRLGVSSGYAIKKATDITTRFFWPTSLAAVYPELAKLDRSGLVKRRDDPHGGRSRSAYEMTRQGRAALVKWLRSPHEVPLQFRDEGVLKLYFADALSQRDQQALVRRLRSRARDTEAQLRAEILPLAEALAGDGPQYPAIVARLGADTYAFVQEWLARLEKELDT
jgi:DNA-binding PadR family transcriptional regulator